MYLANQEDDRKVLLEPNQSRQEFFDVERNHGGTHERPLPVPNFIKKQKSGLETSKLLKCICCCKIICCPLSYRRNLLSDIKNKELGVYYTLKSLSNQLYEEDNPSHEESLKFLYITCLNSNPSEDLRSKEWTKLGFQV